MEYVYYVQLNTSKYSQLSLNLRYFKIV